MNPEAEDLAYLERLLGGRGLAGPGDDAARLPGGGRWLATADPVVEGVHWAGDLAPEAVGRKLVRRNASDLAAMAAEPKALLCTLCFGPGWDRRRRRRLYRSIRAAAAELGAAWIGGDLSAVPGPSVFAACLLGPPMPGGPIRRAGLRPGDRLHVTGPLGGAPYGHRHHSFRPRLAEARRLVRHYRVHAMIDVSDGLLLDLARLLAASGGLGAVLDAPAVPVHAAARRSPAARGPLGVLGAALEDGEDYELLFGLPAADSERIARDRRLPPAARRPIGCVEPRRGLRLRRRDGRLAALEAKGFGHALA